MKFLSVLLFLGSSSAFAYPGWDDSEVIDKAVKCVSVLEKNGLPPNKARSQCVCFLDYTMSRFNAAEFSILQTESPELFTRFMDKAWGFCYRNNK
jgi:hypothetical protein